MKITKIVVDEMPECCANCMFTDWAEDACIITSKQFSVNLFEEIRESWCPLELDNTCSDCNGSGGVMVWNGQEDCGVPDPCFRCKGTGRIEDNNE